jgi:hypothetical protein
MGFGIKNEWTLATCLLNSRVFKILCLKLKIFSKNADEIYKMLKIALLWRLIFLFFLDAADSSAHFAVRAPARYPNGTGLRGVKLTLLLAHAGIRTLIPQWR